jgi:undecaprenyl-diphosphatase
MRPGIEAAPIDMGWWSFPSSNATMSMVFFGMLAYFIVRDRGSWQLKVLTAVASALIVFLIGLSSIYLQLNYLSDVIAGFVGGLFWLTICITGLEVYRKSKQ